MKKKSKKVCDINLEPIEQLSSVKGFRLIHRNEHQKLFNRMRVIDEVVAVPVESDNDDPSEFIFATEQQAKQAYAFAILSQLLAQESLKPYLTEEEEMYTINRHLDEISVCECEAYSPLRFNDEKVAKKFLKEYEPVINTYFGLNDGNVYELTILKEEDTPIKIVVVDIRLKEINALASEIEDILGVSLEDEEDDEDEDEEDDDI